MLISLFAGAPVPICPRVAPFVRGVDRVCSPDDAALEADVVRWVKLFDLLVRTPNQPFRFGRARWH